MGEWKYLYSEAFKARYVLAARWLADCDCEHVFEIGGYKTPIDEFITHRVTSITSIDPRTENYFAIHDHFYEGYATGITRHQAKFPDVRFHAVEPKSYGLVVLGLELHLDDSGWGEFFDLVRNSKRTVFDVVVDHIHSVNQFNKIMAATGAKIETQVTLDLSGNDFGDLTDSAPPKTTRKMVVLSC
jgi:hypothetical protein